MPGQRITKKQVNIYMQKRKDGLTQMVAAAKAGISEHSGRNIDHNEHCSQKTGRSPWRTRKDAFEKVWDSDIAPMLKKGLYEATFVLNELQKKYPGEFHSSLLRTLQRRIKLWKAVQGPNKEVMFLQIHEPGQLGVSDFTHPKDITVTINGEPFEHIFYHFRLPYSGFNYAQVFAGSGESFNALAQGLSEALYYIGGAPKTHRTDSLSASFKNINKDAKDDITERYQSLIQGYGMEATRINPGKGHENGTIESSHRHMKDRIRQSLILRENNEFESLQDYRSFIQAVVKEHNKHTVKNFEIEQKALQALPPTLPIGYTETVAVVHCTSTIDVKRVTYTVPSRLIGERLHIRIYENRLECYVGINHVITLYRTIFPVRRKRGRVINYVHIVDSLIKKPGAFRSCKFRDDLLPSDNYRKIWEYINHTMPPKEADKFMVGILHLAATERCQNDLESLIVKTIQEGKHVRLSELRDKFVQQKPIPINVNVSQHILGDYNLLIPNFDGAF